MSDNYKSIQNMYKSKILEAVHERRFGDAFVLVTERNDRIWQQRGLEHKLNFSEWMKVEEIFTKEFIAQKDGLSDQGEGLIFIVGLPRSGKSTMEKLLETINGAAAGDELRYMSDLFRKIQDPNGETWRYPDYIPFLPDPIWGQFGKSYAEPVRAHFKGAKYVIDTMPPNFRYAGLIRLILPKAKLIHMTRDPMGHIIDIFSKVFKNNFYDYSYNWGALTELYIAYRAMMGHWDRVLGDWMLTVQFEDMVANPKKEIRKVIEFCGIESDISPTKLVEPHKAMFTEMEHAIATLKNYHPFLKDLEKQLGVFKRL